MALKDSPLAQAQIKRCKFADIWHGLDAEDQEILGSWVKAGIGTKKIAKALTDDGHEIAPGTIFSHLASDCFCDPDHIDDSPYGTRQQGANA